MSEVQEEIGNKLFERYDKNLDRLMSLAQFVFIILGFYSSIVIHYGILNKLTETINNKTPITVFSPITYSIISFIICFASVIFAILVIMSQIKIDEYRFEIKDDLIQFSGGGKLEKNNKKLFSIINTQIKSYKYSVALITCSLFSFLEYIWLQDPTQHQGINFTLITILFFIIFIGFIISVVLILHFFLHDIYTFLYESSIYLKKIIFSIIKL